VVGREARNKKINKRFFRFLRSVWLCMKEWEAERPCAVQKNREKGKPVYQGEISTRGVKIGRGGSCRADDAGMTKGES